MSSIDVIYIKNRVNRSWVPTEDVSAESVIPEDEKTRIRDSLVPLLANSEGLVRQQLIPVMQRILQFDYPTKWPRFMDYTMELLNTNNPGSVLAGLQCLLAICRAFRFKAVDSSDRHHFDSIVEASFPRLLAICNELVNQESDEAGEMLHLALKAYKHATWVWHNGVVRLRTLACRGSCADRCPSLSLHPTCDSNRSTLRGAPSFCRLFRSPNLQGP